MKRLTGALVILLLLGASAFYASLWYGARSAAQELGQAVSPWGNLRWDVVRPTWDGNVMLQGVRWHWFDITRPVKAQRIILEAPGLLALPKWLLRGEQPSRWQLQVDNLELVVEPDLFRPWARTQRALSLKRHPLHFHGCGKQPALTPADLLRMGVDRASGDVELVDRGSGADGYRYHAAVDAGRLGSLSLDWRSQPLRLPVLSDDWTRPALPKQARLLVRDAGLMRRLSSFCAAAEDEPVAEWVRRASRNWADGMAEQGLAPTGATTSLYRDWLAEGGELALEWALKGEAWPGTGTSAPQWQQKSGLRVIHNDHELEGIGFSVREPREPSAEPERSPLVSGDEPKPEPAFRESDTERASAWIDRRVRLELSSGRRIEGRLVAREGDQLHIRRRLEGGTVVAPFQVTAIERFEVWRRADDMGRPVSDGERAPGLDDFLNPDLGQIHPIPPEPGSREK
ncbi:hypothetical protein ACMDCT_11830 [Halomonadaceae bacterium KBTZ08]